MKTVWVLFLYLSVSMVFLVLIGCAPTGFSPVKDPSAAIEFENFSVLPPSGSGWYVARTKDTVSFGKGLDSRTHTVGATVARHTGFQPETVGFPEYATNPEVFAAYVKAATQAMNPPGGRMRFEELTVVPDREFGYCAKLHAVMEDHGSPVAPQVLQQEDWSYTCLHPASSKVIIEANFSERGVKGESDPALEGVRRTFFENIRFK